MGFIVSERLLVPFAGLALLVAACGGSSAQTTPTSTPDPTPSPTAVAQVTETPDLGTTAPPPASEALEPDGERILQDVITLSNSPRTSTSALESIAADEIAGRLRSLGYEVSLQEFSVATEQGRSALLSVLSPSERTIPSLPLGGSATAKVEGRLVSVPGIGAPEDLPAEVEGAIALIERGTLLFQEKVDNAADAGAIGVVIYNNETGTFLGGTDSGTSIPAVTISQRQGEDLKSALAEDEVIVEIGVGPLSDATSQNVVAKPPDAQCETITGGHYDSVPQVPGASDNASGTSAVLEIAAVLANRGERGNNCFVLFGAEELGLLGSKHFVSTLTQEERDRIKAMLNFDMVGVGEEAWWLIGTPSLTQRTVSLAADLGIQAQPSNLIGTSSDHASFLAVDIPAVMFHRWQDPLLHTPQDVADRVNPEYLEQAARMGLALLRDLSAEG